MQEIKSFPKRILKNKILSTKKKLIKRKDKRSSETKILNLNVKDKTLKLEIKNKTLNLDIKDKHFLKTKINKRIKN